MAGKNDPLAAWMARMQPTATAQAVFDALRTILEKSPRDALGCQAQEFPPKYVQTISARVPRRRGKIFATVAAVAESVYFDLVPDDLAIHRQLKRLLSGSPYRNGEGFELTGNHASKLSQIESLVQSAVAGLGGKKVAKKKLPATVKVGRAVPPMAEWSMAMLWIDTDLKPVRRAKRFGPDAAFVRCTIAVQLGSTKGVGVKEVAERGMTGLIELARVQGRGKRAWPTIVAVHCRGLDRGAWSFRLAKQRKREFMPLFVGTTFTEQLEAPAEVLERWPLDRVEIVAAIPWEDGSFVKLALSETFEVLPLDDDEDEMTDDEL